MTIGDGYQYLENEENKTDLIIADMYLADGIDEQQLSQQFIVSSYSRLNDNGWLVLNYWLDHKLDEQLVEALQHYFDQVYMCDTGGGNWVIYAGKVDINKSLIDDSNINYYSKAAGFSFKYFLQRLKVLA